MGDGNLTQVTVYPGSGAANRVTDNYYDWRDRLVATKEGVQSSEDSTTHRPITYYTLDNLGEVTETQQLRRRRGDDHQQRRRAAGPLVVAAAGQTVTSYDDQGRVYQTQEYSVDPSSGSVSTYALTTNYYYNHRGEVIEESDPGGLVTKKSYDGAGRETVEYSTDGGSGTSWSDGEQRQRRHRVAAGGIHLRRRRQRDPDDHAAAQPRRDGDRGAGQPDDHSGGARLLRGRLLRRGQPADGRGGRRHQRRQQLHAAIQRADRIGHRAGDADRVQGRRLRRFHHRPARHRHQGLLR